MLLKYIFAFIMLIHGLIHFMGFAKAYHYGNITQLTKNISKPAGSLWFFMAMLFVVVTILFLLKKESWPYLAIIAAVISQILILTVWHDAKFGTIANVIVILVAVAAICSQRFEASFVKDVKLHLQNTNTHRTDLLTEADIQSLPLPVQKYLRYCNVLNKPKVKNIKVVFDGEMREKGKDWFKFQSVQYNFFDEPTRLFFMKAKMYGTVVPGYHRYQNATATMQIKLFGLFNVVNIKAVVMNKAETVTLFNDMCLMERMQRLFLKVRGKGIAIHPMTQIIEEADTNKLLNNALGINEPVQFILRTGYLKNYPAPVTLRRSVDRFVRI